VLVAAEPVASYDVTDPDDDPTVIVDGLG